MARKKRSSPVAVRNKNPGLVSGISDLIGLTDEETDLEVSANNTDMAMIGEPSDLAKQYANEERDLFAVISEVVDSKDIVPRDLKIDDSSMSQAKNYYDWCTNEEFLGSDMPPYLEQALIGVKLFSEYCARCSDLEWMDDGGHDPQDGLVEFERRVVLLEYGVCPKCQARRSHMMRDEELNFYNELAVNAGQRSGKSALVAMLSTYLTHRILKAQKPTQLFRVKSNTVFHGTFVALTYAQAKDTLWEPYYQYLCESPWFQKYHALLRRYEQKYGHEIFKLKDTFVLYRHRSLMVYPAGPDKRTLRGRTRIFGCIPGDQLISTSEGLIRMDKIKEGWCWTNVGASYGEITKHVCTGTKEIWGLKLKSGQELKATPEHKICVYRNNKFKKVKLKNLLETDRVVISTGAEFSRELKFTVVQPTQSSSKQIVYAAMAKLVNFTRKEIKEASNGSKALTKVMTQLRRSGMIERHYRKGVMYTGMERCYYNITDKFNLSDLILDSSHDGLNVVLPECMTDDLASILGYLTADGNVQDKGQRGYRFDTTNLDKYNDYCDKVVRTFGIAPRHLQTKRLGKKVYRASISHRPIIEFLQKIGCTSDYSAYKQVPWSILQAPESCAMSYIRSAFDCDGGFLSRKTVYYRSTSKELIKQIQQLLLRLRIASSFKKTKYGSKGDWHKVDYKYGDRKVFLYRLDMSREFSRIFVSHIGFDFRRNSTAYDTDGQSMYEDYYEPTKEFDLFTSEIEYVKPSKIKVKTYDMTVNIPEHAYQASGMLVSNSVDEIGWFDNDKNSSKVKINGSEVYIALERSLRTVRNSERRQLASEYDEALTGYFMNISSPSSQRDKICELIRQSHGSKKLLGLHKPTWEMNPDVTRADLDDEFRKDHGTAMRDYGAQPPLSSNPFITSEELVKGIIKKTGRNFANVTYKIYKAKDGAKYRWGYVDKVKSCEGKSVMAVDAGYSNNCFALSIGSLQKVEVNGEEVVIPVLDIVVEINPLPSIPLHYPKIYENIMIPLIEARNVKILLADRWNSIKLLQDAEISTDIDLWKQYSLKYSDFVDFKTRMQQQQILIPRPHVKQEFDDILALSTHDEYPMCFERMPVEHFILQMLTVQDAGKTVIKGDDLTDDIWRASVLCMWGLTNPDFIDILKGSVVSSKSKAALGVASYGSKGSTGKMNNTRSLIGTSKSLGNKQR